MSIDNLKERLEQLSPAKRALLEKRLREAGHAMAAPSAIPRLTDRCSVPLSFAQQRLWFLNQITPESPAYNESKVLRLSGCLNVEALRDAFTQLVRRHETLRTTFTLENGAPVQCIAEPQAVKLPVVDLAAAMGLGRQAKIEQLIAQALRRPFNLAKDHVLRVLLLRLAEDEHILVVVKHHIASDGWSSSIFWRELAELYTASVSGQPAALAELPIQYADYAAWQGDWLKGDVLETQLAYWRNQLANLAPLELPTDRPHPAVRGFRGEKQGRFLHEGLAAALKSLSHTEGATLFMTLLAAFQALLHRYTGQQDIVVGSPIAGRNRAEVEGLIGFFANTLVLRTGMSGDITFRQLLGQVRSVCLDAYSHQDVPFEKLVEELQPERSMAHNPLFQIVFQVDGGRQRAPSFTGIDVSEMEADGGVSKFDIDCSISAQGEGLFVRLRYNTEIFNADTISRMLAHYHSLLESIVAHPDRRLCELEILSTAEKHQIVVEWNTTRRDYPDDRCIHELFERQVEKTPNAIALVCADEQVTYRELNRRANGLAHDLSELGVGPDQPVAICLERSTNVIVGLLAILKAGGAYVPLDPEYPTERLHWLLNDTSPAVILTKEKYLDKFAGNQRRIICVDGRAVNGREDNLEVRVSAENLAYIMYTSGSTGQPKGVMVPHRGVVRLLFGTEYAGLDSSQVVLHLAPLAFDASTFEIWGALLHGGKCVLYPNLPVRPAELRNFLHDQGITTHWLTSSLFNSVIEEAPTSFSGVKQLLIGGEALSVPHVSRALAACPQTQIINGYGPTESTTFTCCYPIPADFDPASTSVPIGRPIANTEVYILDPALNPVPIGVAGEIHIGGDGLARGYLNQRELSQEKFIAHPFHPDPNARLYKTGDLARYLPDGNIEFLGRIDDQVKIRGHRIEPGEITAALNTHPGVRAAHVVARRQVSGDIGLTAYFVRADDPNDAVTPQLLRDFLAARLPRYMLPSSFVELAAMPLTANGKVDRGALPEPTRSDASQAPKFTAPRDSVETVLCREWAEVLKVPRVGIDDDFFMLGGHSLLAAKLFSRLDDALGRSLPLSVLFSAPTIRALAEHYRSAGEQKMRALVALRTKGKRVPIFAVPGVYGNVLGYADLARELGDEQPFYGLQSVGLDGAATPLDSIEAMASLYLREIRSIQPQGPYALIGSCFGASVAYEMTAQLLRAGQRVAFLGLLDPTRREGVDHGAGATTPKALKRAAALGDLVSGRLHLYLDEMSQLGTRDRLKFVARKLRSVGGSLLHRRSMKGVRREIFQLEVYQANLRALDRFVKKPIAGKLPALEIFETARAGRQATSSHRLFTELWHGPISVHAVAGKDSGDMISGDHAHELAKLLTTRLQMALNVKVAGE